jgi:hypothetical protein
MRCSTCRSSASTSTSGSSQYPETVAPTGDPRRARADGCRGSGSWPAAASYRKPLIIKLINDVAKVINRIQVRDLLRGVLPDCNVSLAEVIIPAADLSEQISTPEWRPPAPAT